MSEDKDLPFAERVRRATASALEERKKAEDSFLDHLLGWIVDAKNKKQPEVTVFTTNLGGEQPGEQNLSTLYADVWRTLRSQNMQPFWKRSQSGTWNLMIRI